MRASRLLPLLCVLVLATGRVSCAAVRGGQDVSGADVFGVRLYMDDAQARDALRLTLPRETAWRDTRIPCADEQGRGPAGPRSCLSASVLAGPTGVVLRYVEDLPAHPHRSIVAEAVVSQEPREEQSKRLFHLALLRKYGRPDLHDPTGMQWGQVVLSGGQPTLVRTLPMLESSNDEIVRLSDSGLCEREAAVAAAGGDGEGRQGWALPRPARGGSPPLDPAQLR